MTLKMIIMALGINQVTYSNRKFCRSVGPGVATLGTSRYANLAGVSGTGPD